jgi:putative ABC transport system permease protein
MVGRLAQLNAQRDPARLTTTAASMMVGVALVSAVSIMGASASASVDAIIKRTFTADVVVSNLVGTPFSGKVAQGVAGVKGVTVTSRLRVTQATASGGSTFVAGIDPATYGEVTHVVVDGKRPAQLKPGEVLVASTRAQSEGLELGSRVTLAFGSVSQRLRVAGIFEGTPALPAPFVVPLAEFDKAGIAPNDSMVFARLAAGTDRDAALLQIEKVVKDLPTITVKDDAAFAEQQRAPIDRLLGLVNALLALSLLIALLGIVNTLTLSVSERVHEIGLLRAVGLGRAQVARMIRLEAAVVALLGASVGLLTGVVLGVLIQRLLVSEGMSVLAIPWPLLGVVLVLAGVAGVLAAVRPGKKAAGMEIIAALRTD